MPRARYYKEEADSFKASCTSNVSASGLVSGGGAAMAAQGRACKANDECSEGERCDAYCPLPEDGRWVGERCWLCDAVHKGGLVDPSAAKREWEELSICSTCLGSQCVCQHKCSVV